MDKLRDHGRGHRRRGVLDAFGYSNEHVDVTTEREDDSKMMEDVSNGESIGEVVKKGEEEIAKKLKK